MDSGRDEIGWRKELCTWMHTCIFSFVPSTWGPCLAQIGCCRAVWPVSPLGRHMKGVLFIPGTLVLAASLHLAPLPGLSFLSSTGSNPACLPWGLYWEPEGWKFPARSLNNVKGQEGWASQVTQLIYQKGIHSSPPLVLSKDWISQAELSIWLASGAIWFIASLLCQLECVANKNLYLLLLEGPYTIGQSN